MPSDYIDQVTIIDVEASTQTSYGINRSIEAAEESSDLSLVTAGEKYNGNNKFEGSDVSTYLETIGIPYLTSAPVSSNSSGNLILVFLSSEPTYKYEGYLYFITEN